MLHHAGLLGHGAQPGRVGEAERVDPDAGGKVKIGFAAGVAGDEPLAPLNDKRAAGVGVQDIVVVPRDDFFPIHGETLLAMPG